MAIKQFKDDENGIIIEYDDSKLYAIGWEKGNEEIRKYVQIDKSNTNDYFDLKLIGLKEIQERFF